MTCEDCEIISSKAVRVSSESYLEIKITFRTNHRYSGISCPGDISSTALKIREGASLNSHRFYKCNSKVL